MEFLGHLKPAQLSLWGVLGLFHQIPCRSCGPGSTAPSARTAVSLRWQKGHCHSRGHWSIH